MIGFRVDANEHIASGHLMRCLTIAQNLRKIGQECKFYLAENKETDRISSRNFEYQILNSKWDDLNSEKEEFKEILIKDKIDLLVVDSYQADNGYLSYLNKVCKVLYIDDMSAEKYDVTATLHYGLSDENYIKKYKDTKVVTLTGSEYIPLREEFSDFKENVNRQNSVLITTGGTDTYNITMEVLKSAMQTDLLGNFEFYVIVGSMNQFEEDIRKFAEKHNNIHVLKNINNMGEYMKKCRYAVSAGGTTLYELSACKTPTVCFSFADNQYGFAKRMGTDENMLFAGDPRFDKDLGEKIVKLLCCYIEDEKLVAKVVANMSKLVDGNGAKRVAMKLKELL